MENSTIAVPGWIYNFSDYCQMFDLNEKVLNKKILDFPGGLSSFNAEMHSKGYNVISRDLFANLSVHEIEIEVDELLKRNELFLNEHKHRLKDSSPDFIKKIIASWKKSKDLFLADYMQKDQHRYREMQLPKLPFQDHQFDLALCVDLLFHTEARLGYSPEKFLSELCRVALEVRAFPLLDEQGKISNELGPTLQVLQRNNFGVEIRAVPYEEQKGNNAMLRIWTKECVVENECGTPS